MRPAIPRRGTALILFVLVVATHTLSENKTPWDSRHVLPTATSLVRHGDADLSEYVADLERDEYYGIEWVEGRPYSFFPMGPALFAVPFVGLIDLGVRAFTGESFEDRLLRGGESDVEEAIASIIVALATVVMFHVGRRCRLSVARSFFLALIFAFATPAWATCSRALWQHGPSVLLLATTLLPLLRAEEKPRRLAWAALPLALSFVVRPTNAISVAAITGLALSTHRRRALGYLGVLAAVALLVLVYDLRVYGQILPDYYSPSRVAGSQHVREALAGNLISPARGLLVFVPWAALALVEGIRCARRGPHRAPTLTLLLIVLAHWLTISRFAHWWGGHCYGPRLFSDMTPYLVFLLVPLLQRWGSPRHRWESSALVILTVFGLYMNAVGAMVPSALRWNVLPRNVDQHTERLWDWSDPQFLRFRDPTATRQPDSESRRER